MSIKLTMTCGPYDRAQALIDGTVKPEGIDHRQALTTRKFDPEEMFHPSTLST
jgi:hypothetical protein